MREVGERDQRTKKRGRPASPPQKLVLQQCATFAIDGATENNACLLVRDVPASPGSYMANFLLLERFGTSSCQGDDVSRVRCSLSKISLIIPFSFRIHGTPQMGGYMLSAMSKVLLLPAPPELLLAIQI